MPKIAEIEGTPNPNAMKFIGIVNANNDNKRLMLPKEILFIASMIYQITQDPNLQYMIDRMVNAQKLGTH